MVWFPARERATAVGVNQAAVNVSGMIGAAIMPALALAYGWQAGFLVAAALAFAVFALALVAYRDPPPGAALPRRGRGARPAGSCACRAGCDDLRDRAGAALRDRRRARRPGGAATGLSRRACARATSCLLGFAALFLCMVEFAALAHLVLFLKMDYAYSVAAAGGLLAFCQAAGAIGKPLSGFVSDRLLDRRRKPALLFLAGLAGLASAIMALSSPGQTGLLWLALALMGIGAVGWGGLFGTLAGETAGPAAAGAAAGVTAAIDNVGIFIGPPLFGWIVDRTGSYAPAWWTMVVAAACAVMLLTLVHERRESAGTVAVAATGTVTVAAARPLGVQRQSP